MTRPAAEAKCDKPMRDGATCARRAGHRHRCLTRDALDHQRRMAALDYVPVQRI